MSDLQLYPTLMSLMAERFSCRNYDATRPVDHDLLRAVLDAARIAPSACNRQPWQFLVIDSAEGKEAIAAAYSREWIRTAATFIIAIGNHDEAWHRADGKDHTDVDLSIAVEHICLAATALGLGTCWVCNFDAPAIRSAFGIADPLEPIAIIPIGYPAADAVVPVKNRKTTQDIIKWGKL